MCVAIYEWMIRFAHNEDYLQLPVFWRIGTRAGVMSIRVFYETAEHMLPDPPNSTPALLRCGRP